MDNNKQVILDLFCRNVYGKVPELSNSNQRHDGKEGHWLEQQFEINPNNDNAPDINGYELKKSANKITFGDWSPTKAIFKQGHELKISKTDFLSIFGGFNSGKQRYSWSGQVVPKIGEENFNGQKLIIDSENNIFIEYSFSKDTREKKYNIVPAQFQQDNLILLFWNADFLKGKVENKFNQNGWFKVSKNNQGVYETLSFGHPINFDMWIKGVRDGYIFIDSAMHQEDLKRNHMMWRANKSYWNSLIYETWTCKDKLPVKVDN
jgi:hypothetical protein